MNSPNPQCMDCEHPATDHYDEALPGKIPGCQAEKCCCAETWTTILDALYEEKP